MGSKYGRRLNRTPNPNSDPNPDPSKHLALAARSCRRPSVGSAFWSNALDRWLSYSCPLPRKRVVAVRATIIRVGCCCCFCCRSCCFLVAVDGVVAMVRLVAVVASSFLIVIVVAAVDVGCGKKNWAPTTLGMEIIPLGPGKQPLFNPLYYCSVQKPKSNSNSKCFVPKTGVQSLRSP